MPTYEYECKDCGHQFEVEQKISDEPLSTCPKCKGAVRRLISSGAFALKGGGWYKDGYTDSGKTKKPKACEGCPSQKKCDGAKKDGKK